MRLALAFTVFGPVKTLIGLAWPWAGPAVAQAAMPGFIAMSGMCMSVVGLALAAVVRGAGRGTIAVLGLVGVVGSATVVSGMEPLFTGIAGAVLLLMAPFLPVVMSILTIRIPIGRKTIKLYPATAASVEITRDHEGVFALRHPDGRVLSRGADAVHLLQGLAGPLTDHGLLWGGEAPEDGPALSVVAIGDRLEALIPTRTTLPLVAAALPLGVWEALLGLEADKFPVVAGRLAKPDPSA